MPFKGVKQEKFLWATNPKLAKKWTPSMLLMTLGAKGMLLLSGDREPSCIPTRAQEVFDVSGAGDTVIAALVLAIASGANISQACVIANHCASIVIGKQGTATLSVEELEQSF